jgi:hypothetical protein
MQPWMLEQLASEHRRDLLARASRRRTYDRDRHDRPADLSAWIRGHWAHQPADTRRSATTRTTRPAHAASAR